jgi:hypothetical protein
VDALARMLTGAKKSLPSPQKARKRRGAAA